MYVIFQFVVNVRESIPNSTWVDVPPGKSVPFWPMQSVKHPQVVARIQDSKIETVPFCFNQPQSTLLKLDHQVSERLLIDSSAVGTLYIYVFGHVLKIKALN